jgi:hypothetical protein
LVASEGRSHGAGVLSGEPIWFWIHLPMRRSGSIASCGAAHFIAAA